VRSEFDVRGRIARVTAWNNRRFKSVAGISAWMVILVLMITVFGHYGGIFLFCVILMRFLAWETWLLTLLAAGCTTFFIYGVFEFVFDVELYRGLVVRYLMGFRDF
jgi:ABC-type multidrug transport system permease subunit